MFHLFRYLDEQTFRYNQRKLNDAEQFVLALGAIVGKRLTYDAVTGKGLKGPPNIPNRMKAAEARQTPIA